MNQLQDLATVLADAPAHYTVVLACFFGCRCDEVRVARREVALAAALASFIHALAGGATSSLRDIGSFVPGFTDSARQD